MHKDELSHFSEKDNNIIADFNWIWYSSSPPNTLNAGMTPYDLSMKKAEIHLMQKQLVKTQYLARKHLPFTCLTVIKILSITLVSSIQLYLPCAWWLHIAKRFSCRKMIPKRQRATIEYAINLITCPESLSVSTVPICRKSMRGPTPDWPSWVIFCVFQ